MGMFKEKVNVAIDEHDEPYYGKENRYLINVENKKFRGTDKAIKIASLDIVIRVAKRMEMWILQKDFLYYVARGMNFEEEVYFKMLWKKMHKLSPEEVKKQGIVSSLIFEIINDIMNIKVIINLKKL